MSLQDLQQLALKVPYAYEINWEHAPDASWEAAREGSSEQTLKERLAVTEQMYLRLLNGESAAAAGRPTALSEESREQLLEEIADELINTYAVMDAMNRYKLIMDIIKS